VWDLEEILGVVQAKDLLTRAPEGKPFDIKRILHPPLFVGPQMLVIRVLELLRTSPTHMVFVVNEHGTVEGLVTATDVVKWIIGHHDETGSETEPEVLQREDGSWLIDGDIHIDVVTDLLNLREVPIEKDFHTLAGFMLEHFERIPAAGDHFEWGGLRFEVVDMDGLRIDKVLIAPLSAPLSTTVTASRDAPDS
jgi:putative hemolysin